MVGATPLASANGFVDIAISSDGRYAYQLLGLKGSINVHSVGANAAFTPAKGKRDFAADQSGGPGVCGPKGFLIAF